MALPEPTFEAVQAAADAFDRSSAISDAAVALAFEQWPHNGSVPEVLAKVIVLNRVYSTNIYAVQPMAEHIVTQQIDDALQEGDPGVVERIACLDLNGRLRRCYSFATKYCAWHHPELFQMFDSNVERALWAYQRRDRFAEYRRSQLWDFASFMSVVDRFRQRFGLLASPRRDIDRFLWQVGFALQQ